MLTLRNLAIVITAAGVLAGVPLTRAQACDNDRFPCPVVPEASAQETAEAPARVAPSAQPRKKTSSAAHRDEKVRAKAEREGSRAASHAKATKPAVQEQATEAGAQHQGAVTAPAEVPPQTDQPLNDEAERNESPTTAAAAAWLALPKPDGAGAPTATAGAVAATAGDTVAATTGEAVEAGATEAVHMVDPNEVNELDLAALPAPAASSWLGYLLVTLGAALAAATTVRFFLA